MMTVKLSKPIEHDGKTISELTFREPTLGDLIAGEAVGSSGRTAQVAATLAGMADIPFPVFKKISAADFDTINQKTAALVGNGEAAGTS